MRKGIQGDSMKAKHVWRCHKETCYFIVYLKMCSLYCSATCMLFRWEGSLFCESLLEFQSTPDNGQGLSCPETLTLCPSRSSTDFRPPLWETLALHPLLCSTFFPRAHRPLKTLYKIHLIFPLIELQFPAHLHYTVWESHFGFLRKFILKMRSLADCSMGKSLTALSEDWGVGPSIHISQMPTTIAPKKSSLNFQTLWAPIHTYAHMHTCTCVTSTHSLKQRKCHCW